MCSLRYPGFLCERLQVRNFIQDVQAMYNPITRAVESELIPCVQTYGGSILAYNMLAGGLLSGKYNSNSNQGNAYFHIPANWRRETLDDKIDAITNI